MKEYLFKASLYILAFAVILIGIIGICLIELIINQSVEILCGL
jgi:hypothetical protein